ncbi:glycosyltransferase family 2 protein [Streptomyces gobiensis]|uniref:glycosyltransferase family 2 protein n=1 Tax=Streptomyces gobiensis TaxID=2875706 RepID=UPI001E4356DA|nr:glycosyltransferase [Streptomyces gobiensis]UGY91605.1 glycosyltransferase [Streptomyces gobiensis]
MTADRDPTTGELATGYAVVIPTLGRDTLARCLTALAKATGPEPDSIVLVDDRPPGRAAGGELPLDALGPLRGRARVARGEARGPAAARNTGWRMVEAPWTVFLDDDVCVGRDWRARLIRDLAAASEETGGVQGVLQVPLPLSRRPTDWERNTAGLARARWATADMAYRTRALRETGGFDERFQRAFREDADLALRVLNAGWDLRVGQRQTEHPVRRTGPWVSVSAQRGNADDALMLRLHGPGWRWRAQAPPGRIRRHLATTAMAGAVLPLAAAGKRRAAALAALGWALATAEFAWARISPGPRTPQETATMLVTSVLIPPVATAHRLRGQWRWRAVTRVRGARGERA